MAKRKKEVMESPNEYCEDYKRDPASGVFGQVGEDADRGHEGDSEDEARKE